MMLNIVANVVEEIKMATAINLIFPNQLFAESALLENGNPIYLIEEYLFFRQYKFHKQKIALHRASMKSYQAFLEKKGLQVIYINSADELADIRQFKLEIERKQIIEINIVDPVDYWLEKRIKLVTKSVTLHVIDTPLFLNTKDDLSAYFTKDRKSFFQTTFYQQQRKKFHLLLDHNDEPMGGKWTYDVDNRKKYPKDKTPPSIYFPDQINLWDEAVEYTEEHFGDHLGEVSKQRIYPINHKEAKDWLLQFLEFRFHDFGIYEDAIVKEAHFLNHSVLSSSLNLGLILPSEVIAITIAFADENKIPINSTEGFVRQIIGWREFMRGMYECKGVYSRTKNFWGFTRKIPASFYDGTTGITPIDETIKKVLKTGYCHHIERLMILGNFMLLCEFHPDDVYRWFMELFIDAYDWVMVPNIYGMSQFADGGTFATKPYIGGSNYIKKMSDYKTGDWADVWDGLFWRFINVHQDFFKANFRMSMMYHSYQRMEDEKKAKHLGNAELFLDKMN